MADDDILYDYEWFSKIKIKHQLEKRNTTSLRYLDVLPF